VEDRDQQQRLHQVVDGDAEDPEVQQVHHEPEGRVDREPGEVAPGRGLADEPQRLLVEPALLLPGPVRDGDVHAQLLADDAALGVRPEPDGEEDYDGDGDADPEDDEHAGDDRGGQEDPRDEREAEPQYRPARKGQSPRDGIGRYRHGRASLPAGFQPPTPLPAARPPAVRRWLGWGLLFHYR
jgi:hypothetical protein